MILSYLEVVKPRVRFIFSLMTKIEVYFTEPSYVAPKRDLLLRRRKKTKQTKKRAADMIVLKHRCVTPKTL